MSVDWAKPIMTKKKESAELLHTFSKCLDKRYLRLCLIGKGSRRERVVYAEENGIVGSMDDDIINVPEEKVVCVVNVYPTFCESHSTRQQADDGAEGIKRTHVITISRIEGDVKAVVEKVGS